MGSFHRSLAPAGWLSLLAHWFSVSRHSPDGRLSLARAGRFLRPVSTSPETRTRLNRIVRTGKGRSGHFALAYPPALSPRSMPGYRGLASMSQCMWIPGPAPNGAPHEVSYFSKEGLWSMYIPVILDIPILPCSRASAQSPTSTFCRNCWRSEAYPGTDARRFLGPRRP